MVQGLGDSNSFAEFDLWGAVAKLHLEKIGAKLSELNKKQSSYINIPINGPFKNDEYRY